MTKTNLRKPMTMRDEYDFSNVKRGAVITSLSKTCITKTKPTSDEIYERARRRANLTLWAIDLQCRRLRSSEQEDDLFIFRKWADFDFLIVCLTRFHRFAKLAASVPEVNLYLTIPLREFQSALPNLKRMRDVAEHFDDYAVDKGRLGDVKRQALEVSFMNEEGTVLSWLDVELNSREALVACQKLFAKITAASHLFVPNVPKR